MEVNDGWSVDSNLAEEQEDLEGGRHGPVD